MTKLGVRKIIESKKEKSIHDDGGGWLRGWQLGKGTYGTVHLAVFPNPPADSGRFKGFPSTAAVKSADATCLEELQTEKMLYESLGENPYILRYLGEDTTVGSAGARLNLFIEYASGGSLYDLVRKSKGLGLLEPQARQFTRSIVGGIKHIHEAGFVHCDLKPHNVLLVREGQGGQLVAKIGDLGSGKREEEEAFTDGTLMFLAPECLKQGIQGKAADIWGLGCIVFSMLTGTSEWDVSPDLEENAKLSSERCSEEAADFVRQCLSSDPTDRPTAATLLSHPFVRGEDERKVSTSIETRVSRGAQCRIM